MKKLPSAEIEQGSGLGLTRDIIKKQLSLGFLFHFPHEENDGQSTSSIIFTCCIYVLVYMCRFDNKSDMMRAVR